jgi:enoyl-CoA hydratase/carnithine racemase
VAHHVRCGAVLQLDGIATCRMSGRNLRRASLFEDTTAAILQLDDAEYFNTFSNELGEDVRRAVQHICYQPSVEAVILQGAGAHFSVGGNPYSIGSSNALTLDGFVVSLREMYDGFLLLRSLSLPIVGAVHGNLVGGGIAGCLHADHLVADRNSSFEHGNLVRGVCVLGMLSETFAVACGPRAAQVIAHATRPPMHATRPPTPAHACYEAAHACHEAAHACHEAAHACHEAAHAW